MSKRHLNIAVVFIWALAHGVWIGAGMHSFAELGQPADTNKGVACAACVSVDESPSSPSAENLTSSARCCAVCKLSTVLPEVSVVQAPIAAGTIGVHQPPLALDDLENSFATYRLPPAHAPPV